jgi:cell filamentation protein
MADVGYDAFDDPYAYPGTTVLRNKLHIRDAQKLQEFEVEASSQRANEALPNGRLSATHYCAVHRHLFQDVYAWAGRYRTVRTAKGGNWFCYPEYIGRQMSILFTDLKDKSYFRSTARSEFVKGAAEFLSVLNVIHPFREGNGRSQLSFIYLIAEQAGHPIDLARIQRESFLRAMIASFHADCSLLEAEIDSLLA